MALIVLQNGTIEEVKKIVTTLNEAEVPSEDVVGMFCLSFFDTHQILVFNMAQMFCFLQRLL